MNFNSLVFPAPTPSYTAITFPDICYCQQNFSKAPFDCHSCLTISFTSQNKMQTKTIPYLYLRAPTPTDFTIIYFHGNAEDIGIAYEFLNLLKIQFHANVICMEYPGYGIYEGDPSAEKIEQDALDLYDHIIYELQIPQKRIVVMGRSIGTGTATFLAAKRSPLALTLISGFTSLSDVISQKFGSILSLCVANRFQNIKLIKFVQCPVCFIHGAKDTLISAKQSKKLWQNCSNGELIIRKNMTHDDFYFKKDIQRPLQKFFERYNISTFNQSQNIRFFSDKFAAYKKNNQSSFPQQNGQQQAFYLKQRRISQPTSQVSSYNARSQQTIKPNNNITYQKIQQ